LFVSDSVVKSLRLTVAERTYKHLHAAQPGEDVDCLNKGNSIKNDSTIKTTQSIPLCNIALPEINPVCIGKIQLGKTSQTHFYLQRVNNDQIICSSCAISKT